MLPPVKDYVFLSQPDMEETFIVERTGRVRVSVEGEGPGLPPTRRTADLPCLLQMNELLGSGQSWRWQGGWLPILVVSDGQNRELQLFAWKNRLFCQTPTAGALLFPGRKAISDACFQQAQEELTAAWQAWFQAGTIPPDLEPAWDNACRSAIVQARSAFFGQHPRYGVEHYAERAHDAFPPATVAMTTMLIEFGHAAEAMRNVSYYFDRFVRPDGVVDYYGTAISEYATLLLLAARLGRLCEAGRDWFRHDALPTVKKMLHRLYDQMDRLMHPEGSQFQLLFGAPEADTRREGGEYFHNNLMVLRAFRQLQPLLDGVDRLAAAELARLTGVLSRRLERALASRRDAFPFPPYRLEQDRPIDSFTSCRDFAYANYRYYPEMLQSALLPGTDALKIIQAREQLGGEEFGLTVLAWEGFATGYDHWPMTSYAQGLLELGEHERFERILKCHFEFYQTPDTFTAYEHISRDGQPRYARADWCVPAQLTLPILLAWKHRYTPYDAW